MLPIFRTGQSIPSIGFGTWQVPTDKVANLVKDAVDVGYKHIDCAFVYRNEYNLGHEYFSTLKTRDQLFITSKLWSTYHEPHRVSKGLEKTLSDLCLDYLDLYLVHNPIRCDPSASNLFGSQYFKREWLVETWRSMEKLYESGKCKAIGVSNFSTTKLQWLMDEATIVPHVNQVELHPYLPQNKLVKFCRENQIQLVAYSPLGSPGSQSQDFGKPTAPVLLNDPIVNEIASRNNATPAQVLIAWSIQREIPVLVKSSSKSRIVENLAATKITLPQSDMDTLSPMKTQCRYLDFDLFLTEGKTVDDYWDGELFN
uniref:Alcohol dehydrogenase n=1 Tax=Salmo salar TaxID=8030 RepID=B5X720_SALSA|nr:Alcohol dehydrogenase [Salmo salar]